MVNAGAAWAPGPACDAPIRYEPSTSGTFKYV